MVVEAYNPSTGQTQPNQQTPGPHEGLCPGKKKWTVPKDDTQG